MDRVGGLRKRGAEESDNAEIGRNRLVSLKMESVAVRWKVVSGSQKLLSLPNLTRKQAVHARKLRLELKKIGIKKKS